MALRSAVGIARVTAPVLARTLLGGLRAPPVRAAPLRFAAARFASAAAAAPTQVPPRIGDTAPDFTQQSTAGPIRFHEWLGNSWGILFSHPRDHTPVCTTELGYMQKVLPEFEKRNVKVLALSVDGLEQHKSWVRDIQETQGVAKVTYPILADEDRTVSQLYGMLDQTNLNKEGLPLTVRSVFVIGPDKKVKLIITYPASTGRSFDEILRVVDSLQLTEYHKVATPVNWKQGDECVIVPSVSNEEAKKLFPQGWKELRPYLRLTPQPGKKA